ncbi:HlyD family efflux transporter periplasmic adaptor subunit [Albimonas sp. CAU 1670]|uniref:efflux RND transporter periplasmic adaptor subunit n=1 Tax=Albimonas sp. CAU 1670 TaxID=3032599 RepID=UPI0023DBDF51|nr:HlyD family efflux transporter periplasmic adaptor subunit [Albimonas sp. CAU 1670]MDF2233313.1 HlyD family efflux transporter periplasmic adaptor subunit [Albimonas sp. CAU 1670]
MRFVMRSLTGLVLLALAAALIANGAWRLHLAQEAAEAKAPRRAPAAERVFAVEVVRPQPADVSPTLTAYGEIVAARRLELRPALPGRLVELSPAFVDGGAVRAGELLFRLDPADAESAVDRAEIALAETETDRAAAARTVELAEMDLEAAEDRVRLQRQAMERQKGLAERLVGSTAAVESAELNLAVAVQTRIDAQQALSAARTASEMNATALRRAQLELADARRALADTEVRAPFDGLLTETAAVLGRQVAANEKLGALIDPRRLEAAVRVSNAEYARLLDDAGGLRDLGAEVRLELGEVDASVPAHIARAAAATGEARTGRTLYLALDPSAGDLFREGDFVAAAVREPVLEGVAVIPAAAATEDGRVLIVDADDRLRERRVRILRRVGETLIVADAPFGERMVAIRKPQLGAGARARVAAEGEDAMRAAEAAGAPIPGGVSSLSATGEEMLSLTPERRAALRDRVRASNLGPAERARLLDRLDGEAAPRGLVERLEGVGAPASDGAAPAASTSGG